jgi:hypothetical protein
LSFKAFFELELAVLGERGMDVVRVELEEAPVKSKGRYVRSRGEEELKA